MSREMKDSGIEWIGTIPSVWETSKLKYLGHYRTETCGLQQAKCDKIRT